MNKTEIKKHISMNFNNMLSIVLRAQVDNLKSGESYAFVYGNQKQQLINNNDSFSIVKEG